MARGVRVGGEYECSKKSCRLVSDSESAEYEDARGKGAALSSPPLPSESFIITSPTRCRPSAVVADMRRVAVCAAVASTGGVFVARARIPLCLLGNGSILDDCCSSITLLLIMRARDGPRGGGEMPTVDTCRRRPVLPTSRACAPQLALRFGASILLCSTSRRACLVNIRCVSIGDDMQYKAAGRGDAEPPYNI